jgi:glycosyltransferase involved in cell wall biosynthesis
VGVQGEATIAVIIPALDEEETIGPVLDAIPAWVDRVLVVDNGSTDRTAALASRHGAEVLAEPRRGYGAACLRGLAALPGTARVGAQLVVVFLDGDGADDPAEMGALVAPLVDLGYDLVIGSRTRGDCEPGALSIPQRFGNRLCCWLTRRLFGVRYTDLGPFRAIRWRALEQLGLDDRGFGLTIQMQVRAARRGLRITEVPVSYRRRAGGRSKISGTLRGVVGAGSKILRVIAREALEELLHGACSGSRAVAAKEG